MEVENGANMKKIFKSFRIALISEEFTDNWDNFLKLCNINISTVALAHC